MFVQVNGTVLDAGESLDSERVLQAAGPSAALHLHIGEEGAFAGILGGQWLPCGTRRHWIHAAGTSRPTGVTSPRSPSSSARSSHPR